MGEELPGRAGLVRRHQLDLGREVGEHVMPAGGVEDQAIGLAEGHCGGRPLPFPFWPVNCWKASAMAPPLAAPWPSCAVLSMGATLPAASATWLARSRACWAATCCARV